MTLNLGSLAAPISMRPAVTLSDEELMRFSAENKMYKIERTAQGEITIMSPVGGIGSIHEAEVFGQLHIWNKSVGTGQTFGSSAGFNLRDGSCLSPDVAWLDLRRWNTLTLAEQTGFPPLCPDFIIEIRSASDHRHTLESKMQLWLQNGAKLAWLIDPTEASVTVYRPSTPGETVNRPPAIVAYTPVEGFVLDCTPLWTAGT